MIEVFLKIDKVPMFEGADEFLVMVFNEVNELTGIHLNKQKNCEYRLNFPSIEQFTRFYSELARSIPGDEAGKKPFVIRFRFDNIPSDVKEQSLVEIMQKRYQTMHIPMAAIKGTKVWEIRYPSAEAYFASFIELIDLSTGYIKSTEHHIPALVSLNSLV